MVVSGLGLVAGARAEARVVRTGSDRAIVEARFSGLPDSISESVDAAGGSARRGGAARRAPGRGQREVAGPCSAAYRSRRPWVRTSAASWSRSTGSRSSATGLARTAARGARQGGRPGAGRGAGQVPRGLHHAPGGQRRARPRRRETRERAREQDLLTFGLEEIAAVAPEPDEDVALAAEAARLQAVDDLRLYASKASVALSGAEDDSGDDPNALGLVATARRALEAAATPTRPPNSLAGRPRSGAGRGPRRRAPPSYLPGWTRTPSASSGSLARCAAAGADSTLRRDRRRTCSRGRGGRRRAARAASRQRRPHRRARGARSRDLDATLVAGRPGCTRSGTLGGVRLHGLCRRELVALALPRASLRSR